MRWQTGRMATDTILFRSLLPEVFPSHGACRSHRALGRGQARGHRARRDCARSEEHRRPRGRRRRLYFHRRRPCHRRHRCRRRTYHRHRRRTFHRHRRARRRLWIRQYLLAKAILRQFGLLLMVAMAKRLTGSLATDAIGSQLTGAPAVSSPRIRCTRHLVAESRTPHGTSNALIMAA